MKKNFIVINKLLIVSHISFWVFIGLAFVWLLSFVFPLPDILKSVSLNLILNIILFYAVVELIDNFFEKKSYIQFFILDILLFLTLLSIGIYFTNIIIGDKIPKNLAALYSPYQRLVAFLFFIFLLTNLLSVFFQLLQNRYKKERQNLELINEQQAAQLQLLKAQINPHFLFNALNNVYSLTIVKSDEAPKMLLKLSDLLRYVIYDSLEKSVLIDKEIDNLKKFIELFQMRSEDPLNINFVVTGNFEEKSIEPMIFIPIVENCFKHCNFEVSDTAFAKIELKISESYLVFKTLNTFDENNKQKDSIGGIGLKNIQNRLVIRYAEKHQFRFQAKENLFEVYLKITF